MNGYIIPIDDLHEWLIVLMGTVIQIIHVSIAAGYIEWASALVPPTPLLGVVR